MTLQEISFRLALAIIIGGVIGYEREYTNSPAGFRTHILVALGASIISLIQVEMVNRSVLLIAEDPNLANAIKIDMGRLGAQVISGIGFLGAGTILHTKGSIKGLTTAASLWVVACVGLAIGFGYYTISILGGISIVVVLATLKRFEEKFISKTDTKKIYIEYIERDKVMTVFEKHIYGTGVKVKNIEFYMDNQEIGSTNSCLFTLKVPKSLEINEVILSCATDKNILKIYEILD